MCSGPWDQEELVYSRRTVVWWPHSDLLAAVLVAVRSVNRASSRLPGAVSELLLLHLHPFDSQSLHYQQVWGQKGAKQGP